MSTRLKPYLLHFLIGLTWLLLFVAYFFLAAQGKPRWSYTVPALLTTVAAMTAVLVSQKSSNRSFYFSTASLIFAIVFVISPFLKPLSVARKAGESAVTGFSKMILGTTPFDYFHPAKNAEEWIALYSSPSAKKLKFITFPNIGEWTHVCLFPGHSTDAEFINVTQLNALPWKLSDKSMVTTKKEFSAIAFVNQTTKTVLHIQDVHHTQFLFAAKIHRTCIPQSKSNLKQSAAANGEDGPTYSK